ncbi:MAG TPA: sigma-70 family RNA polymerase sigma factor [Chryseosolibacter sp.]|nr:sigma-70 family RNA polymerase sigma factor [Chryseosolibacter sp.]
MNTDTDTRKDTFADEDAIRAAKRDAHAFRPLYEKYYKPVFLFLLHRTCDRDVSADICSQVFLKALTGLSRYEFRGIPFSSWLFRIAINECNSFFRKEKCARTIVLTPQHAEIVYEEMFRDNPAEALKERLPQILQQLRFADLQLIELRFLEGRPFREVGEILSMSETHARVKTYRALEKMKKLFLR